MSALLAQGRYWRAALSKAGDAVVLQIVHTSLPTDLQDLKDLRIEIPLAKWNRIAKNVHSDRKLVGGLLLDFAKNKDRVGAAVSSDRLLAEYQRTVLDATAALVEGGVLVLERAPEKED
jgi:hypothetical protein